MKIGMIGLGKMGGNMARRLRGADIDVVGYSRDIDEASALADECGVIVAESAEHLVEQLTSPVRWAESVTSMVEGGVERFFELGAGTVLCGLNKRNARGLPCTPLGAPADLEAVAG